MSKDLYSLNDISFELEIEINYESGDLTDTNNFNSFLRTSHNSASSTINFINAKKKPDIETCSHTIPVAITPESASENQNSLQNWHNYISIIQKGTSCLYQCKTCLRKFKTKANFKYHKFCSLNYDKPFKCIFCEKTFITEIHYNYHILVHIGERPWKCHVCGHDFIDKSSLTRHSRIHEHRERLLACLTCSKKFYDNCRLKAHQTVHSNDRPFLCWYCGKGLLTNRCLMRHLSSHTEQDSGKRNHRKLTVKPRESDRFICEHCARTFSIKKNLARHMFSVHSTERPFNCDQCELSFNRKDILYQHLRRKYGDRKKCHVPTKASRHCSNSISEVSPATGTCAKLTSVDCHRQELVTIDNSEIREYHPHTILTLPTGNISNDTNGIESSTQDPVVLSLIINTTGHIIHLPVQNMLKRI